MVVEGISGRKVSYFKLQGAIREGLSSFGSLYERVLRQRHAPMFRRRLVDKDKAKGESKHD